MDWVEPERKAPQRGKLRVCGRWPRKGRRKNADKLPRSAAGKSTEPTKKVRTREAATVSADAMPPPVHTQQKTKTNTPLRSLYGNKEVAQKLGTRGAEADGTPRLILILQSSSRRVVVAPGRFKGLLSRTRGHHLPSAHDASGSRHLLMVTNPTLARILAGHLGLS